jgi:hypothetical protein
MELPTWSAYTEIPEKDWECWQEDQTCDAIVINLLRMS